MKETTLNNTIHTPRFVLKELQASDASERYLSWLSDKDSAKYISYKQAETSELAQYIEQQYQDNNCFFWGIFTNNEHIGNIKYQRLSNHLNVATMGILIGEKSWRGRGVAGEIINSSMDFLKDHHGISEINLGVEKSNTPAIKAYENIGFKQTDNGYFNFPMTSIEMIKKLT